MTKLASALIVLAACGGAPAKPDAADAPRPIDAMPDASPDADPNAPDLSCLGQAPPATAPDPLPVAGKLFAIVNYDVAPIANATIVVARRSDGATLAQTTTAADGAFATSIASGGVPVDALLTAAVAGMRPTVVDPGEPLSGGENALMVAADDAELARWFADANAPHAAGDGALVTVVSDCARQAIAGSTVAIAPAPGAVTYYDAVAKRWDPALQASTNGFALVTAPATAVSATARSGTAQFPPQTVAPPSGSLTIAVVTPRN
jgi:hypothetical protein